MKNKAKDVYMKLMSNNIVERCVKTFLETFLATVSIYIVNADLTDINAIKAICISAIATGISAVINTLENKGDDESGK